MFFKIGGGLLVLVSSTVLGWVKGSTYINRVRQLEQLQLVLTLLETEIKYNQKMLPDIFFSVSRQLNPPLKDLFLETAKSLNNNQGQLFSEIWKKQLKKNKKKNALWENDIQIMKEWGSQIGRTSLAEQTNINDMTLEKLKFAQKKARKNAEKNVKLFRYGGFLLGFLLIVLFY
ncbi:MAG: hypothetical protein ACOC4G_10395 [Bacillota bacterium]